MLIGIIADYLRSHKRLIVPQLGGFLVKEGGTVVFSELLRRDDGVLRGLLVGAGMSELAAAGEIDRFVFEVRHALEQGESRTLPGLGILRPGPQGTMLFEYRPDAADASQEEPVAASPASPAPSAARPHPMPSAAVMSGAAARPGVPPQPAEEPARPAVNEQPAPEPESAQPAADRRPSRRDGVYRPKPRRADAFPPVKRSASRKPDRFLLIGIAALLIALAAIAYGYYHDWQEQREADRMLEQLEQMARPEADAAAAE